MSDKYRISVPDIYARQKATRVRNGDMNKATDAVVGVAKLAIVGSVAAGIAGSIVNH